MSSEVVVHNVKEQGILPGWVLNKMEDLEHMLGFYEGVYLTGMTIKRDEEGWFVVLKATRKGEAVVHYTGGRSWPEIWEFLAYEITHKQLSWRKDKYAK